MCIDIGTTLNLRAGKPNRNGRLIPIGRVQRPERDENQSTAQPFPGVHYDVPHGPGAIVEVGTLLAMHQA